MHPDKDLIVSLGGPTKLAQTLGYDTNNGGVQRVQNWMSRGIPPRVILDNPHVFQFAAPPAPELAQSEAA